MKAIVAMKAGLLGIALSATAAAQSTTSYNPPANPLQRFTVGGRDMVLLDFAATPVGDFPSSIKMLSGVMEVVDVNGTHMLRASAVSFFLITLPQAMPQDFTVEAVLIPKDGFNPEDIAFEGTPEINQGRSSANVMWHPNSLRVNGGGLNNFEAVLPQAIQATAGHLTQVVMKVEGETIRVYTNGRLLSTLPNRKFVRSRVLRVLLGGQDDGKAAVYLAQLRIVDNAAAVGPVAPGSFNPGGTTQGTSPQSQQPPQHQPNQLKQPAQPPQISPAPPPNASTPPTHSPNTSKSATSNVAVLALSVSLRQPWGASVTWPTFSGATQYRIERREAGKPFTTIGTLPENPSGNTTSDIAVRTSTHYDYQATALDANGTILAMSALQGLDMPAQYPTISGLAASVGSLQQVWVVAGQQPTSTQGAYIAWSWDVSQLSGYQYTTLEHITTDPSTGKTTSVMASPDPTPSPSGFSFGVAAGTSARFCVSVVPDPDDPLKLAAPTCNVAAAPPAPRTSTTNTKVTNALDDGPAPTVTLTPTPGGIKVSWTMVAGSQGYPICRESPPGSACTTIPAQIVSVVGNVVSMFDLGLTPTAHAYRVSAVQANGHYGESPPVTAVAGALPAPQNARVSSVSVSPYQVVLQWDPVTYEDVQGPKTIMTYQVTDGSTAFTQTVNGTQVTVPLSPNKAQYDWQISAVLAAPNASPVRSPAATVSYTCRYRVVVLGFWARGNTNDQSILDGAGDEVYVTTAVNVTNRTLASGNVTTNRTSTFGDVAGRPNRIKAGTLSSTGGLKSFNPVPDVFDLSAPVTPAWPMFPYVLWEGALDDQAMVVVHTSLWEEGNSNHTQLAWVKKVSSGSQSGYTGAWPRTLQAVTSLRDANDVGPATGEPIVRCAVDVFNRTSPDDCVPDEDRPIGLLDWGDNRHWSDRDQLLVLTHGAVEKALATAAPTQPIISMNTTTVPQVGAGVVAVAFKDSKALKPFAYGEYYLYLKVERVP